MAAEPEPSTGMTGDPLPPWQKPPRRPTSRNIGTLMIDFVELAPHQLMPDRMEDWKPNPPEFLRVVTKWPENHGPEIAAAENGDIEPLRKEAAAPRQFLHLPPEPKRKQGQRATGQLLFRAQARAACRRSGAENQEAMGGDLSEEGSKARAVGGGYRRAHLQRQNKRR